MRSKHSLVKSSFFVSIPALLATFLLCITTAFYGNGVLSVIMANLFFFSFIARIWSGAAGRSLDCTVTTKSQAIFPGETITADVRVKNDKFIPVPWIKLMIPFSMNESLLSQHRKATSNSEAAELASAGFSSSSIGEERLGKLLWYEEKSFSVTLEAMRRGINHASSWYLSTGDGFGLSESNITVNGSDIVVYPEIVSVDTSIFQKNLWNSSAGPKGMIEDVTVMRSVRDYQEGDGAKYINWRLLARGEKMKVNIYEEIEPKSIHIIFDGESFSGTSGMKEEMESAISILASSLLALENSGMHTYLTLPDSRYSKGMTIMPQDGIGALLTSLAAYEPLEEKIEEGGAKIVQQQTVFSEDSIIQTKEKCGHFFYISAHSSDIKKQNFISAFREDNLTVLYEAEDEEQIPFRSIFLENLRRI